MVDEEFVERALGERSGRDTSIGCGRTSRFDGCRFSGSTSLKDVDRQGIEELVRNKEGEGVGYQSKEANQVKSTFSLTISFEDPSGTLSHNEEPTLTIWNLFDIVPPPDLGAFWKRGLLKVPHGRTHLNEIDGFDGLSHCREALESLRMEIWSFVSFGTCERVRKRESRTYSENIGHQGTSSWPKLEQTHPGRRPVSLPSRYEPDRHQLKERIQSLFFSESFFLFLCL